MSIPSCTNLDSINILRNYLKNTVADEKVQKFVLIFFIALFAISKYEIWKMKVSTEEGEIIMFGFFTWILYTR